VISAIATIKITSIYQESTMKISILSAIVISVLMVGCGGSSSGKKNTSSASSLSSSSVSVSSISSAETSSAQASSLAPVATGIFLDAAVANIGYRTATQEGFTNVNGEFNYRLGELITFYIGGLEFPSVMAAEIITPLDIANVQSLEDNQVINILRLLQSLDKDGDASNGIEITAEAIAAGTLLDFTVAPEVFAELPAVKALLQAAGSANQELISAEQAVAHFQTTLEFINGPSSSSSSNSSSQSSVIVVEPSSSSASSTPVVVEPSSSSVSSTPVVVEPSSSSVSSTPVVVVPSSSSASSETIASNSSVSSQIVIGSSSSSSSEEPVNPNVHWNVFNGLYHPAANDSVTLADGSTTAFDLGASADYFTAYNGTVTLDTSAAGALTSGASIINVVNANGIYPKYFTLIAGITGNEDGLRVLELEVAMADEGVTGSRLKAILRNDGSNRGLQLESANGGTSVNSYGVNDMDKFAIYQIAITLTSPTKGSVQVYRNGQLMPNLTLTDVTMRPTSAAGENFLRFGEVSGSAAYKSTIDWLVWTNEAALTPAQAALSLPVDADLGCVYGYGEANDTTTCFNPPASSSSSSGSGEESSSSSSFPAADIRPAKMEGFAAHAGVTGGAGGPVITVTTGTELNAALCGVRNGNRTAPVTIMVNGTINHANTTSQGCDTQNDVIEIKNTSNISIIGVGTNALFDEIGIHVRDASNIILQNLHIRNVKKSGSPTSNGGDAIGLETRVDRVWIDHNWLEASGGEKAGYDSLLDMKAGVTNVTVSYNLFNDSSRAGLIGSSDSDNKNTNITFHHNWYKNIEQRTPLIRHATVHVYNNYWSNPTQNYMFHGINSRMGAKALVESNYFHNTNNPLIASDDSKEPGCWQTNNDNTVTPSIYYSRTVGNGALVIPAVVDGQLQSTCEVTVPYTVTMDAANDVPSIVMANAGVGKIGNGGDSGSSASNSSSSANSSEANSSSSETSSQQSSSSSSAGTAGTLDESFDVDKATLFSAVYQSISTDPTAARYFITGGGTGITVSNNELTINGGRFTIGHRPPRTATTAADTTANGDFDLNRPYRISFNVTAASGAGKMQVYVDNNTTSQGNSIHAAASKVFEAVASTLTAGQLIEITPAVGTPTSFIAFRTESSANVTIDNLKLEYLDEGSSGSSESSVGGEESSSSSSVSSEVESSASESSVSSEAESSTSSVASSESSSEESSSSSSAGIINTQLPISENFDNVVDAAGFFSVAYKALATEEVAFYHGLSGAPTFANGEITLGNARFTLGNTTPTVLTTSGDTETTGELDLSQPYRISFCVKATQGAGNFQVFVNNNTTGQGNSIHANSSRIYSGAVSTMTVGQRLVINSTVGDTTSFIALRAESTAQVTIDDLWIGYQADTSTEPAADTCVAPTPAAPNAPVVTAGDQQLSVSWSAVAGATSYEVIYNTVDSIDGATAFENNPVAGTSAVVTGLTNDTTYFVFVRAVNASGNSDYSVSTSGTPIFADEEPEEPSESTIVWTGEALKLSGSTTNVSGSVNSSSDTALSFTATGGKFESSKTALYLVSTPVSGDFVLTAKVKQLGIVNESTSSQLPVGLIMCVCNAADAGTKVMALAGLIDKTTDSIVNLLPAYGHILADAGSYAKNNSASIVTPGESLYLKLVRSGTGYTSSFSTDGGINYTVLNSGTFTASLPTTLKVGAFSAAGATSQTFVFEDISITQN
jgi:pectate lyase